VGEKIREEGAKFTRQGRSFFSTFTRGNGKKPCETTAEGTTSYLWAKVRGEGSRPMGVEVREKAES